MTGTDAGGEPESRAYGVALRALGRKERTVHEMRGLLERKGVEPEAIEPTLERLSEVGGLDDAEYARRFVEDRRSISGWGRQRIAAELDRRGVPTELAERALAGEEPEDELDRAASLLTEKGFRLDGDRDRNRALGFLVRRGFELDTAYAAIRRAE